MSNPGVWKFRALVAAAAVVMLVSWFLPWWTANIEELGDNMVQIRPWGLRVNPSLGSFEILLKGAAMPAWFAPCTWVYLGLCLISLLVGLWVREREFGIGRLKIRLSQLLIGGVGVSYIVAAVIAVAYASMRLGAFYNAPLQGRIFVDLGETLHTYVSTNLLLGYYLTYFSGFLLIVLALLRGKITDNSVPGYPIPEFLK